MVALFARGRALLASPWLAALLITDLLSQSWTPEERAGALASGLSQIGAGHPEAVGLVKEALGKHPALATIIPPGFDGPEFLPPLTLAAGAGNGPLVSLLLEAGAEPNPRTGGKSDLGWTPLFVASREGHASVVSLLMDVGGVHPADCVATGGVTPLMAASEKNGGQAGVVGLLLSRAPELDVDARDLRRGMTALHLAALHSGDGDGAVISALVQQGRADPWAVVEAGPSQERRWRAYVGFMPFHLAIAQGELTAAEALWRAVGPAVLTTPTATGLRPLHVAIEHRQQVSLEWLLQTLQAEGRALAAVSDREERTGATPLIYAVRRGGSTGIGMVEALLRVVAPAGLAWVQDWNGLDALHTATALAAEDATDKAAAATVRLLLMAGADPMERVGAHLPDSLPVCTSFGGPPAGAARPLPHEGWTAQALAVARGRMDLLALLSEGHPVADVALDAWAALAAMAERDEGLRLAGLDYVVRGAVRHAGVVRALLGRAPSTKALGNASTLFPEEVGLDPGAPVTALDVACYEGQWDAAHALRPPRLADPRLSLHQHRQPRRWSLRLVSPLAMAVRGGHPELVRDLAGPASTLPDRDLACGLRALAEAVLETASITAEAEVEGSCVARRRLALRREVLAVLEEELPCQPEAAAEEEEECMDAAPAEEELVVVEEEQQDVTAEEQAGVVMEEAHPQLKEEKAEEEAGDGTCAAPEVERPSFTRADVLLLLFILILFGVVALQVIGFALQAISLLVQLPHRLQQRGAAAVLGQGHDSAAVESTQGESLVERASPSFASEEALSTPTSDEQPLSPSADLAPAASAGKDEEQEEVDREMDKEEEEDEEEEENHLGLSAFTMGTLMMGPSRLPPEASRRLLEEMRASPEALRRLSSSPPPPPPAPAAPSDDSQPKVLSFAEEAGGEGDEGEAGAGVEGQGASGDAQEELPVGEEAPAVFPAVQALGEALEAEKEKEQGPRPRRKNADDA